MLANTIVCFPVHASGPLGENYSLSQSATRVQEANSPGVTFVLNVTKATVGLNYQFTWLVRDPTGSTHNVNTQVNTVPSTFTTSVNYPSSFGTAKITYVGTYNLTVTQSSPPSSTFAATTLFVVGLTGSLNYQRSQPVSILAQGYGNAENVNITIAKSPSPPILSTSILANSTGQVAFTWPSIPVSTPLGNYTISLSGKTVKTINDLQWFRVNRANMTIPQLSISLNTLERTRTELFHFTASYPTGAAATTGSAVIQLTEPDGTTIHDITAVYKSTAGQFQALYQIPLNSTSGVWVASIDIGAYNDGYGNIGPTQSVARGFAVSPATLTIRTTTSNNNYTTNGIVGIYASIVTPGNENFTSGTITARAVISSGQQVESPMPLSYDQTRGEWVGSFTIKSTDASGVWIIQVNATDSYGNTGYGSTSILVSVPPPQTPQQSPTPTFNYLLVIIGLATALAVLGSWVIFRRGRVSHKVLRVDLEAVHAEAAKVQNNEFFKTVQDQLRDQRTDTDKLDNKSSDK